MAVPERAAGSAFRLRHRGGLGLLHVLQPELELVQRQGLSPAAEAVALQFLDDLGEAVVDGEVKLPRMGD